MGRIRDESSLSACQCKGGKFGMTTKIGSNGVSCFDDLRAVQTFLINKTILGTLVLVI